jgi:hypothetical protein
MSVRTSPQLLTIAGLLDVPVESFSAPAEPHRLHDGADGECWLLLRDAGGTPVVRHVRGAAAGGHVTECRVDAFLARDAGSPPHRALTALIDTVLAARLTG